MFAIFLVEVLLLKCLQRLRTVSDQENNTGQWDYLRKIYSKLFAYLFRK